MPASHLLQRAVNKLLRPWRRRRRSGDLASLRRALGGLQLRNPVVIILTPGSLHLARLAWGFVPAGVPVVLVLNGVDAWEAAWARANLPSDAFLTSRSLLGHAEIIDACLDHLPTEFGLLDHDCLVLNPEWFGRLAACLGANSMSGCFPLAAPGGLDLLHTFFLWFNPQVCRDLKRRFGVSAAEYRWEQVSEPVREALSRVGYRPGSYPEADKSYFDTLRLLQLLGAATGVPPVVAGRLDGSPVPTREVFHIGGVSYRDVVFNFWIYRGCYLWRTILNLKHNRDLAQHYAARFGEISPDKLAEGYPEFHRQF
ncbi:MAG: hypothetical protein ACKOET_07540, partial [Verrucomicrobiota bacterium]